MHNVKYQCKIDLFRQIVNAKGCGRADAQFNSVAQSCPDGPFLDCPEHPFLQINTHHMARFSNQARHRQSKEPIPLPTSSTIIPSWMYGFRIFSGLWRSFLRGLTNRYPSHQGHTLWLMIHQRAVVTSDEQKRKNPPRNWCFDSHCPSAPITHTTATSDN